MPIVGALIGAAIGQERLDLRRLLGLFAGLAGVGALLGLDLRHGNLLSFAELGVVVIGYATGPLIVARRPQHLPQLDVVAVALALCAIGYAPFGIMQLPAALPGLPVAAAVLRLGLVCTALAFVLFFSLIAEVGPVVATVVNPAVAVLLGVSVLGEPLGAGRVIGFALILAGSYFATQRPKGRQGLAPGAPAASGDCREGRFRPARPHQLHAVRTGSDEADAWRAGRQQAAGPGPRLPR